MKKPIEPVWDPGAHDKSWRAVWAYSRKRATRDGHVLTLPENRAKSVVASERAARTPPLVTTQKWPQTLNEASLARARARRHVGLKGYVTKLPADLMPTAEFLASYHDVWPVEVSFRMRKTDLRASPILHHTANRSKRT